jgi:hypothetical protein
MTARKRYFQLVSEHKCPVCKLPLPEGEIKKTCVKCRTKKYCRRPKLWKKQVPTP